MMDKVWLGSSPMDEPCIQTTEEPVVTASHPDQRWWRRHAPDDYVTASQAVRTAGCWADYYLDAWIKRGPQEDGYIRREMRTEGQGVTYRAWQIYRWGDIVDALRKAASADAVSS